VSDLLYEIVIAAHFRVFTPHQTFFGGDKWGAYRFLAGRSLGRRPQGRRMHRWGGIILIWVFRKWNGEAWTGLIWVRVGTVVGACECSCELLGGFLTSSGPVSFSGRTVLHGVNSLYIHIKKFEILMMPLWQFVCPFVVILILLVRLLTVNSSQH
jgi:hypothetical protein